MDVTKEKRGKRGKRGKRMDPTRKKTHIKMEPIVAMTICGPIARGDQNITSKCLTAVKFFKEKYTGKKLQDELRNYLYKDIERLLVARRAKKEKDYERATRHLNAEMYKVTPHALRPRIVSAQF